ncbi:Alkaline phosphatase (EC [uncultured Gammaproteobacteria bacterium]|nr:Alkaline phosphatase (EC [uncultured Gammaproteobacteria bacterium]
MSLTNEEQQEQDSLSKVKLAVDTVFSAQVETARILGASDDALKAMNNTFKFKGGALGIAQIALATNQEGAAGGIDAAISWGIGTLAGIAGAALFSNPITAAVVLVGVSFGGSELYNNTASNSVKSTLNNWFNDDITPEQKQQQFNIIVDGASSEFKQAFEAESGQTLEQIKREVDFNANKNILETPGWVDDALAEINQNPLNKFQDQLDATANNPELKDSVKQVENEFKDETTTNKDIPSYDEWFDKKYTNWFNDEFNQWFDTNYLTYLNEQYDDYLDEKHDEWQDGKHDEWQNEKHDEWQDRKSDEWRDEKYDEWQDRKSDEWRDEKYDEWQNEKHDEWRDEKSDEWRDEKSDEWRDEKSDEWRNEKYDEWQNEKHDEWQNEKYDEWYNEQYWEKADEAYDRVKDEKYREWRRDYRGEQGYDQWFEEEYDGWFNRNYDNWFNERYDEWFSEQYDNWFNENYDEWFDENYDEWFDENYDEWFDENYNEWFNENYNEWFNENYNEWFDENYNEWFDENYDEWFDQYYSDEWFSEQYDKWFDENYNKWFDENYNKWFDDNIGNDEQRTQWNDANYSEWQDEKYTEWSSQKYQEWKDSKYDKWVDEYNNEYSSGAPVILDLDGNGIEITTLNNSNSYFDFDDDTYVEKTAWTTDAILVFDENNDGQITSSSEIAFAKLTDVNDTDLEALKTKFDSNDDNILSSDDAKFNQFKLWQDKNQNGTVDAGELQTLTQAGIRSINLISDGEKQELDDGSVIFGKTTFTKDDGTLGEVADVALKYKTSGHKMIKTNDGYEMRSEQGFGEKVSYFHTSTDALNINLKDNNYDIVTGNIGDDTLDGSTTDYDVLISGGAGDDALLGGSGDDILIGGAGLDTFKAGSGNDTITVNNSDILTSTYVDGGEGYDKLVIKGDNTVNINLDELNIESVVLGGGVSTVTGNSNEIDYLIIGGSATNMITTAGGKDIIYGGETIDTINSGAGDDYIVAGDGNDIINAGGGDDIIYGGTGNDTINAGSGKDTIYLEGDLDVISGGSDADVFKLSYQDQAVKSGLTNLIKDFELGVDTLDLSNVKSIRSMDDITISTTYQNGKTYAKIEVEHNKNAIYLEGVSSSSLTKDSFKFYNHKAINLAEVSLSTNEDQSFTITSTQLLANAIDVDGDDLSVVSLSVVSSDVDNVTLTDNNNGTWTLTPKANFSGEITFNYQISDGYELTDAKLNLAVANLLDAAVSSSLMIDNAVIDSNNTLEVASNSTLALPITAALNDTDGSETLSISIKNLPSEITLNNGIKQADGSYLLSQNDLSNLQLIIGSFSGHLNIEIEATSIELSNSDTVTSSKTLSVDVIQTGDANDNQLMGDDADNIIRGLAGDDTITGNQGDDALSGGLGSDTFDYNSNNDGHDIITDFNLSEGDKLDISDLIDYQSGDNLADFVGIENIGNDSIVHIDLDSAGSGQSYVSITLFNTTLSFEDLSNANALIVL